MIIELSAASPKISQKPYGWFAKGMCLMLKPKMNMTKVAGRKIEENRAIVVVILLSRFVARDWLVSCSASMVSF